MPEPGEPAWAGTGEPVLRDSDERDTLPDVFGSDLAHLFDYCRALLEQDAEAARTVRSVLDSATGPQQDPDRLRARLLSVGRAQALAMRPPSGGDPCYLPRALITAPSQEMDDGVVRAFRALTDSDREILDLVYRHGIRAASLAEVLGIPTAEAYRRLAIAEGEFLSLIGEPPGRDADPVPCADGGLEDIAALPLAPLAEWTAHPATRLPSGERRSRSRPARLVTAAVISGAMIGAVVWVGAASHPTDSRGVIVHESGASAAGQRAATASSPRTSRSATVKRGSEPGLSVYPWAPGASPTVSSSPPSSVITGLTVTVKPPPCPAGIKANFRWHYTADGSAGGWSGTTTQSCPGSVTMGPQAMAGNLQVAPGTTLKAGYDFTLPGNSKSLTMTVSVAQVVFAVSCVSGAAPSAPALTVALQAGTYQITGSQWYPSGDQSSPLVYQGSATVPALCGASGEIRLAKGGTFTATLG